MDDEEAVEHAGRNRWHSEEIHGRNRFPMVSKEGQSALGSFKTSWRSFHPTGNGSLRKVKTEHAEFSMYPRRSPGWVLNDHQKISSRTSFGVRFLPTCFRSLEISLQYKRNLSGASARQFQV
jgi:hypothetical protein